MYATCTAAVASAYTMNASSSCFLGISFLAVVLWLWAATTWGGGKGGATESRAAQRALAVQQRRSGAQRAVSAPHLLLRKPADRRYLRTTKVAGWTLNYALSP